jgi:putative ABC transport system ATP-binding protein
MKEAATTPLCQMDDLHKTFYLGTQSVEVLRGISLRIDRGEFVAIMGTSGSGKSTLMNLVGCLDTPTSGRYILDGRDVGKLSDDELSEVRNSKIGFVFQSFYLLPYATVLDNVLLPTLYREHKGDHLKDRALTLLETAGLRDRTRFRPGQLSGGEQQRVAICRALMNDPDLILADEPTGQLDSGTAADIMKLFAALNERGKTVAVITHDAQIASYARRTHPIRDGVIVD